MEKNKRGSSDHGISGTTRVAAGNADGEFNRSNSQGFAAHCGAGCHTSFPISCPDEAPPSGSEKIVESVLRRSPLTFPRLAGARFRSGVLAKLWKLRIGDFA